MDFEAIPFGSEFVHQGGCWRLVGIKGWPLPCCKKLSPENMNLVGKFLGFASNSSVMLSEAMKKRSFFCVKFSSAGVLFIPSLSNYVPRRRRSCSWSVKGALCMYNSFSILVIDVILVYIMESMLNFSRSEV